MTISKSVYKARRERWCHALISNQFEQGTGKLRSEGNKYCCLGVACALFKEELGIEEKLEGRAYQFSLNGDESTLSLPVDLRKYLGISEEGQQVLIHLNDHGVDFGKIARVINVLEIEGN